MDGRMTITDVAKAIGVTPRTIMRWEKAGKIKKSKRDWRGWRFYFKEDLADIREFFETTYDYNEGGTVMNIAKGIFALVLVLSLTLCSVSFAQNAEYVVVTDQKGYQNVSLDQLPAAGTAAAPFAEESKYTLGPNDIIEIEVRRHEEFSGQYVVNSEGKIEYKFIGDVIVEGYTKGEVNDILSEILSEYIRDPEIDVTIAAYLSKVFYVVGDVRNPGKYYMKGNTVNVREAFMESGLPTEAAKMKSCRLISPNATGKDNYVEVDAYKLLFEGDLTCNLEMQPGDVLYVPATAMAKLLRFITPPATVVGKAAGTVKAGYGF